MMDARKICPRCWQPIFMMLYSNECPCPIVPEPQPVTNEHGFVLLAPTTKLPQPQFVFATEQGAEAWRTARGIGPAMKVWPVRSSGFVFVTWAGGEVATKKPWLVHQWPGRVTGPNEAWLS